MKKTIVALSSLCMFACGMDAADQTGTNQSELYGRDGAAQRLNVQSDRLNAEIRLLEVEVANMAHSDRVYQQATDRLGMVSPTATVRVAVGVTAPEGVPVPSRFTPAVEVVGPLQRPWWAKLLESLPPVR